MDGGVDGGMDGWMDGWIDEASICSAMAFPPLENSDHVAASVSIDFLSRSKWDGPFHQIAYDYSQADWDGICDYLRNVP